MREPTDLLARLRGALSIASFLLRNLRHRVRGWKQTLAAIARLGLAAALSITVLRANGRTERLGVVSQRVVTTTGVNWLVDAFQNIVEAETLNFHQSGTGTNAEGVGNTDLQTSTGSRVAGTQSEQSANVYRSQATLNYTSTLAITEHGIFTASTGGVLFDRSVFTAVNVANGDAIQFTYDLTVNSGG